MEWKEGNLVAISDENHVITFCVLINITQPDLENGFNSNRTGLHLLRGYWYKTNGKKSPLDKVHYGKVEGHIDDFVDKTLLLVVKDVNTLTKKHLKTI